MCTHPGRIALQIIMAITYRTAGGPAATTRAGGLFAVSKHCAGYYGEREKERRNPAAYSNDYFANHNGNNAQNRQGPSERRRNPATCPNHPSHCFANHNGSNTSKCRGPAATTRAGGPSIVSKHCAGHCGEREEKRGNLAAYPSHYFIPAIALQITMAVTHRQITMAITHSTAGGPAATTRAGGPSAVSEHCAGYCGEKEEKKGNLVAYPSHCYFAKHNGRNA